VEDEKVKHRSLSKGVDSVTGACGSAVLPPVHEAQVAGRPACSRQASAPRWTQNVDIVWFKDPLKHLMSFGPAPFPIQSNEPTPSLPGLGIRRDSTRGSTLRAPSRMTVEAFEAITAHAATTKLSEQPSSHPDILRGVEGSCGCRTGRSVCGPMGCVSTLPRQRLHGPQSERFTEFWEQ